jgi:hypothetical protein
MSIPAYPLCWPDRFPRTLAVSRVASQFKTTLPAAINNVQGALRRFAADSHRSMEDVVISTNAALGMDNPADSGVAVWFTWDGLQVCIAVDRYRKLAENLQAIFHVIEARRVELRHGGLAITRATFQGFLALPAPASKHWTAVLDLAHTATLEDIRQRYRAKAKELHPDAGGNPDDFSELNTAYELAQRERGAA